MCRSRVVAFGRRGADLTKHKINFCLLQPPSGGWLERPRGGSWALVPHVDVKVRWPRRALHSHQRGWAALFGRLVDRVSPSPSFRRARAQENDNELTIHADVPGVKPEDLEVHLDAKSNTVTISGSRHSEKNEQSDKFHVVERTFGSFARSFHVPAGVKEQDISAEFVNGVLGVKVLKPVSFDLRARARPRGVCVSDRRRRQQKSADKGTKIKIATPPATSAKHASEL